MNLKENRGITLIALVVTIVVLLILTSVSISALFGQSGLITKAREAKKAYKNAEEADKQALENLSEKINDLVGDTSTPAPEVKPEPEKPAGNKIIAGEKAVGGNKEYTSNGKTVIIPEGFAVSGIEGEKDVATGLVIYDLSKATQENIKWDNPDFMKTTYNQYVWVPVEQPDLLYETVNDQSITVEGVNISKYTKSEILSGKKRGKPNDESSYREPGILTDGTNGDAKYFYSKLGFNSLSEMTQNLVNDYNDMIASMEKYKGFYIGRYELSATGTKKGQTVGVKDWYTSYKQAKALQPETSTDVQTRMMWGLQWDATCKWIQAKGNKDINNSTDWGNYSSGISPQTSGFNNKWQALNIYDFAGNCWEWTQEAYGMNTRAFRGGSYYDSGSDIPAAYRHSNNPDYIYVIYSSRPTLYVKVNAE